MDLRETNFHVPNHFSNGCSFHFCYGLNHFQYRALPFELTAAPWVFTKILVVLVTHLQLQGIFLYLYLDDILIVICCVQSRMSDRLWSAFSPTGLWWICQRVLCPQHRDMNTWNSCWTHKQPLFICPRNIRTDWVFGTSDSSVQDLGCALPGKAVGDAGILPDYCSFAWLHTTLQQHLLLPHCWERKYHVHRVIFIPCKVQHLLW